MAERAGGNLVEVLSQELAVCRKRGIDRLDVRSHNQQPVPTPELERLAETYAVLVRHPMHGRIAQLKYLLRDAIEAFRAENDVDARLVSALFFGDSQHRVTKSAGELLDIAQKQFEFTNPILFRQTRRDAFDNFAEFLPRFVAAASSAGAAEAVPSYERAEAAVAPVVLPLEHVDADSVPEVQQHIASTGYIDSGEHFVTLLSQAENITIVGYTNESLASMLRLALARKRAALLRQDGCWDSVRIVFLNDDLLDRINDERGYPDPDEARLLRRLLAVYGRRTVRVFLRSLPTRTNWVIYDSPLFPPLVGTLFEMPDRRRIVQLLIRRPQRSGSDHLYLELDDTRGHYFSSVFDEIIESSIDDNKFVPAGYVVGEARFKTARTRYRRNVLVDGSRERDWLPMVLVVTWQTRNGWAEPLLQLRTEQNATRELDRFTHLAGHIMQDTSASLGMEFGLEDDLPVRTAKLRVQLETGAAATDQLEPLVTGRYLHPDKEHLFFFVYGCKLPDGQKLWPRAEMSVLSVRELLSIRENQVLRKAWELCQAQPMRGQVRTAAFEIVTRNLILHDYADIAEKLGRFRTAKAAKAGELFDVAEEIREAEEQSRQTWQALDNEITIVGLSGFQYREFFSTLLPIYRSIGVPGVEECLELVHTDESKRAAVARLSQLYNDERIMESIPIEL